MSFRISNYSYHIINNLCRKEETFVTKSFLLSMQKLNFNNRIKLSTKFLYKEIPIRFSRRIKELEALPIDLDDKNEIFTIRDWYVKSLDEITKFKEPNNLIDCENYKEHINKIFNRHNSTLITMARGISKLDVDENKNFDNFLTNFYYNRTRTRFLLNNYLEYFNPDQNKIGILYKKFDLRKLIESVKTDLSFMSEIHKYETPEINCNIESIKITYPIDYLHYSILEVLKNSLVAINNNENGKINISCFSDKNILIIKIQDNGKGIKDENLGKIWNFSYTTSKISQNNKYSNDYEKTNPMSGFGYGLPISRILLRTFDGDIKIYSEQNIGTTTYLFIDLNSNWKF